MTDMLDKASEHASRLPEDEQNEFAAFMLDELMAEKKCSELPSDSQGKMDELAREAHRGHEVGDTEALYSESE